MSWALELCDWDGPDGAQCVLRAGHIPMRPGLEGHAPSPLPTMSWRRVSYPDLDGSVARAIRSEWEDQSD